MSPRQATIKPGSPRFHVTAAQRRLRNVVSLLSAVQVNYSSSLRDDADETIAFVLQEIAKAVQDIHKAEVVK